jgi:hypothetical protein
MRRLGFAPLATLSFIATDFAAGSAKAGDYYDGYYSRRSYSYDDDDCCARRSYTRSYYDEDYRPRYRRYSSYYDDDYRPRYCRSYSYSRYYDDDYSYRPRRHYYSSSYDNGYSSYASSYGYRSCRWGEVKVEDGRGGWVWDVKRVCD